MPKLLLLLQVLAAPLDGPVLSHADRPLRAAVSDVCGPNLDMSRRELLDRERRLAYNQPTSVDALRSLACLRVILAADGSTAKPGYLMSVGDSWRKGALAASAKILEKAPTDPEILGLVAAILLDDPLDPESRRWSSLISNGVVAGSADRTVLRACIALLRELDEQGEARRCAERGLRAGVDSTTNFLVVASERFAAHDTVMGAWAVEQAAKAARDPVSVAELTWHLAWFLSPEERAAWNGLADSTRAAWMTDRLLSRDVRDGRPQYARLAEHFARLAVVRKRFVLNASGIYQRRLLNGPDFEARAPDVAGEPVTDPNGMVSMFRDSARWQVDFDDRGAVWMRFGPPTEQTFALEGAMTVEAWKYVIDDQTLILTFQSEQGSGSGDATRLVAGRWGMYFCGFDAFRCNLANRAESARALNAMSGRREDASRAGVNLEQVAKLRAADREYITAATTKDDNSVRVKHYLTMNAQYLRVWEPATGRPLAVLPYLVQVGDLDRIREGGEPAVLFNLSARAWDPGREVWHDTTVNRRLLLPKNVKKDAWVSGVLAMPRTDGVSSWSLVAAQDSSRRGRVFGDAISPLGGGSIVMSDLILGAVSQGQAWASGTGPVALAPLGTFAEDEPVELYYQVQSETPRSDARATVSLYRITEGLREEEPALELAFALALEAGVTEVRRSLDVSRLGPGVYFLNVRVTAPGVGAGQGSRLEVR